MRFLTLDLRNYGPFQHAPVLDLSGGDRGLHLIVGPNEAGKSTALRAIRALLFDFPHVTPDNHGRDLSTLRVGATLRGEAGAEVAFLRRKRGTKLWTADDRTALHVDALGPALGPLDAATFEGLFSTDHAELVAGGQAIIRGKGRLGEMLFSAGTGLAQLDRVQKALQAEIEGLFKTRNATLPVINKTLGEWRTARDEVKKVALPTQAWVAADAEWNQAVAARATVLRRKHAAQAELDRWRSWLGALRVIPRRLEVEARLRDRASTAVLRAGFADAYRAGLEASRAAQSMVDEAQDAIGLAAAELAKLGPLDPTLAEADAIGRLHADLGRYAGARSQRPELAAQLARVESQRLSMARNVTADPTVPGVPVGPLRDAIGKLARESAALQARKVEAETELARTQVDGQEDGAPASADLRWVASLEEALRRATAPGDLDAQRQQARARVAVATEQAATSLRGLTLWAGTLADLEALAVPPDATFDRAEQELRAADEHVRAAEADRARLEAERLDLIRQGESAQVGGPIPTEADLAAARDRRDAVWRSIRAAWVDGTGLPDRSPARHAADLEAATREADLVADSLRRESGRVAAAAQRAIDRRDLEARIELAARARDRARADRAVVLDRWVAHWRPLGIEPLSPREMKDWVRVDRTERLRSARTVREAVGEEARIAAQIEGLRGELAHALGLVGEPGATPGESLGALLARGRTVLARIGARAQRDAARQRLDEVNAHAARWSERWGQAIAPLGLGPDATIATAESQLEQLSAWLDATHRAETLRMDLADRAAIEDRFATEARALLARLDPDRSAEATVGPTADWQPAVAGLVERLAHAAEVRTRRQGCHARLEEEQARLARGQAALGRAAADLLALAREAGCPAVADLPAAIRRSTEVEAERADLKRLDEQLDHFAGAMTREELLAAVVDLDEATLAAQIAGAADSLAEMEAEANRLGEAIGAARQRLDAMDHAAGAADAEQVAQGHVARLGVEVEKYARLKLAAAVLRDAVERHRAKHQGPVLDRAGVLFRRLTGGSFAGLQTDLDEKGEPILRGVRGTGAGGAGDDATPAGTLLDVAAMSEGTADQLYLALRLASLAVHLDDHEPAPLVADDILINFDDARARAALEALAELSSRTQVLFFTHHDHLAEIARTCLPPGVLFVHRLTPRGPIGDRTGETGPSPLAGPRSRRPRAVRADPADR